jgi:hypothetical protein
MGGLCAAMIGSCMISMLWDVVDKISPCEGVAALAATGKAKIAEATALSKPNLMMFFITFLTSLNFPLWGPY